MAGKDRKKQLARQRYERQQQRREAQAARARRVKIIGSAVAVAVIAGGGVGVAAVVGGDDSKDKKDAAATPSSSATTTPVKPGECGYPVSTDQGAPKGLGTPPVKPAYAAPVRATVKTNLGDIGLELDAKKAPCTVNSFGFLAAKKFFDKTNCHRLTTGGLKVLQCGDPTGSGSGGPGYRFANEGTGDPQKTKTFAKGVLAMAHSQQPDSNGSQFFMVYGDSTLPDDYTVFGKITSGIDLIEGVAKAGSDPEGDGKPKKSVTIQNVTIAKK